MHMSKESQHLIIRAINIIREERLHEFLSRLKKRVQLLLLKKRGLKYRLIKCFKRKGSFVIAKVQGSKMYLSLEDEGISKDLITDKIREMESTKEVLNIVNKGDVILDIGANIGYYALMEARLTGRAGLVYACEPVPENFELLKRNIQLNGVTNIEAFNIALGDKNGEVEMYLSQKSNLHSMSLTKNTSSESRIKVKLLKVDEFLKDKGAPDFVRMDVEGYENKILQGMDKILQSDKLCKLFIEVHFNIMDRMESVELLNTLKKNDFAIKRIFQGYGNNAQYFRTMIVNRVRTSEAYSSHTIDDILQDEEILDGKRGALEIFFARKPFDSE